MGTSSGNSTAVAGLGSGCRGSDPAIQEILFLASHVREQPYRPVVLGEASQWFVVLSAQFVAASIWYIMLEFLNLSPVSLARPCAIKTAK